MGRALRFNFQRECKFYFVSRKRFHWREWKCSCVCNWFVEKQGYNVSGEAIPNHSSFLFLLLFCGGWDFANEKHRKSLSLKQVSNYVRIRHEITLRGEFTFYYINYVLLLLFSRNFRAHVIIDNGIKKENDLIRLARAPQIIQLADLDVAWSDVTFHSSIFRRATLETVVVTRVIHTLTSKRKRRKEKKKEGVYRISSVWNVTSRN